MNIGDLRIKNNRVQILARIDATKETIKYIWRDYLKVCLDCHVINGLFDMKKASECLDIKFEEDEVEIYKLEEGTKI